MKKKNNNLKENPVMVKQVSNKKVKIKGDSEDSNEIKTFIIIVVVIAVIVGIIYGVTEIFNKKDTEIPAKEVTKGTINYDKVNVGMIFNRPYSTYYVFVYNSKDKDAVLYSTYLSKYMQNSSEDDYIKIYYCDLNNTLNKGYYDVLGDGTSNQNPTSVEDFNFGDVTLIKVSNGNIVEYLENIDEIKEILSKAD